MQGNKNFAADDITKVENSLKVLIFSIATSLNADDTPALKKDIEEMIEFEKKLGEANINELSNLRNKEQNLLNKHLKL